MQFLEYLLFFLMTTWMEESKQFSSSESSVSGCCLAFAYFFTNFSIVLVIKVLPIKKACIHNAVAKTVVKMPQSATLSKQTLCYSVNNIFRCPEKYPWEKTLEKLPPSHRKIDTGNLVPRKMALKNCFTGFSLLLTYLAVVNFFSFL